MRMWYFCEGSGRTQQDSETGASETAPRISLFEDGCRNLS